MSSIAPSTFMPSSAQTLLSAMTGTAADKIPFVPNTLRWILALLAVLNYRALPGLWHLRVASKILAVRLRGMLHWPPQDTPRRFRPNPSSASSSSGSPVGENPFDICVTYKTAVGLSDTDFNGHMTASTYERNLDYARMRAACICFPSVLEAKGWLGLGRSRFVFVKEIPLHAEYEIRINIGGWDDKWLYLVAQYVTYPNGKPTPGSQAAAESSQAGSSKRTPTPPPQAAQEQANVLAYAPPVHGQGGYFDALEQEQEECDEQLATPLPSHGGSADASSSRTQYEAEPHHRTRSISSSSFSTQSSYQSSDTFEGSDDEGSSRSGASTAASSPPNESPPPLKGAPLHPHTSSSPSSSPERESGLGLLETEPDLSPLYASQPPLPAGAILHCIHTSSYCFKHGPTTIPPNVALVVSGFGDSRLNRWARVQEIRRDTALALAGHVSYDEDGRRTLHTGLQGLLKGAWRAYECEGLWNLGELEEQRLRAVSEFEALGRAMDAFGRVPNSAK